MKEKELNNQRTLVVCRPWVLARLAKVGTLANSSSSTNRFIQLLNPIVVGGETSLLLELSVNTTCSLLNPVLLLMQSLIPLLK